MDSIAEGLMDVVQRTATELSERSAAAAAAAANAAAAAPAAAAAAPSSSSSNASAAAASHRSKVYDELCFSFVVHSMGGLVLRTAISSGRFPVPIPPDSETNEGSSDAESLPAASAPASAAPGQLPLSFGRIVMIATPNRGSLYARTLAQVGTTLLALSCQS